MQAYQAGGVAGKVARVEGHLGFHLGGGPLEHGFEELGLTAEVVVDLRLVRVGCLPDAIDAGTGEPVPGELGEGRVQQAAAGGFGIEAGTSSSYFLNG